MKDTKQIIQNEREMRDLFKKNYSKIFSDYSLYKEEAMIRYGKKHGFADIILKHKKEYQYILIEFKFNNTDEEAINQINKYHIYFKKNLSLDHKKVDKWLVDFYISRRIKELCKESNISCLCLRKIPLLKNYIFKKIKTNKAKTKTKLTLSVNKKIKQEFKKFCEQEGLKPSKQIEKYMQEVLANK